MAKKLKKLMAVFLAMVTCMSLISTAAFAEESDIETGGSEETVWYGGEMSVPVTAGTNGYTFQSVYVQQLDGW